MSVFITIISGVAVFVLGQVFLKLVIEPVQEAKRTISKIRIELFRNAHLIHNADKLKKEQKSTLFESFRLLAAELVAATEVIPFYNKFSNLFSLPTQENMKNASKNLVALSNWINVQHDKQLGHILKNNQELADNLGFVLEQGERINEETINALIN